MGYGKIEKHPLSAPLQITFCDHLPHRSITCGKSQLEKRESFGNLTPFGAGSLEDTA